MSILGIFNNPKHECIKDTSKGEDVAEKEDGDTPSLTHVWFFSW